MQNEEIKKWKKHATEALRRMKHSRHYALEENGELCLAATAAAWQEQRGPSVPLSPEPSPDHASQNLHCASAFPS
jgi:hypothetical protein